MATPLLKVGDTVLVTATFGTYLDKVVNFFTAPDDLGAKPAVKLASFTWAFLDDVKLVLFNAKVVATA